MDRSKLILKIPAGVSVEESRKIRQAQQQARYRNRGGTFRPSTTNKILELLMARSVNGDSPKKAKRKARVGRSTLSKGPRKSVGKTTAQKTADETTESTTKPQPKGEQAKPAKHLDQPAVKSSSSEHIDPITRSAYANDDTPVIGPTSEPANKTVKRPSRRSSVSKDVSQLLDGSNEVGDSAAPPAKKATKKKAPAKKGSKKSASKAVKSDNANAGPSKAPKKPIRKPPKKYREPVMETIEEEEEPVSVPPTRRKSSVATAPSNDTTERRRSKRLSNPVPPELLEKELIPETEPEPAPPKVKRQTTKKVKSSGANTSSTGSHEDVVEAPPELPSSSEPKTTKKPKGTKLKTKALVAHDDDVPANAEVQEAAGTSKPKSKPKSKKEPPKPSLDEEEQVEADLLGEVEPDDDTPQPKAKRKAKATTKKTASRSATTTRKGRVVKQAQADDLPDIPPDPPTDDFDELGLVEPPPKKRKRTQKDDDDLGSPKKKAKPSDRATDRAIAKSTKPKTKKAPPSGDAPSKLKAGSQTKRVQPEKRPIEEDADGDAPIVVRKRKATSRVGADSRRDPDLDDLRDVSVDEILLTDSIKRPKSSNTPSQRLKENKSNPPQKLPPKSRRGKVKPRGLPPSVALRLKAIAEMNHDYDDEPDPLDCLS